jgi:hypothetical protein
MVAGLGIGRIGRISWHGGRLDGRGGMKRELTWGLFSAGKQSITGISAVGLEVFDEGGDA